MHLQHDSNSPGKDEISFSDFLKVDIRAGVIERVEEFPEARKPAYKLWIDFGDGVGVKRSSAQITERYSVDDLEGMMVMAVVNFPARQIGPFMSEVLVLGFADEDGAIVLARPDQSVSKGAVLC